MRTRNVSGKLTLSILLLLYGDQLAANNEGVCKKQNHDAYVPSNDLSCQEDVLHNEPFERYRPAKKSCESNFDTTDILNHDSFRDCHKISRSEDTFSCNRPKKREA